MEADVRGKFDEVFYALTVMASLGSQSSSEMLEMTKIQALLLSTIEKIKEQMEKTDVAVKDLEFHFHELRKRVQILEAALAEKEE